MKRNLFFLLTFMIANCVMAQRAELTAGKGWSKLSALPTDVSQYFFAIYDHNTEKAMVLAAGNHQGSDKKTMWYRPDVNPENDRNAVWRLDGFNSSDYSGATGNDVKYLVITGAGDQEKFLEHENAWNFHTNNNGEGWPDRAYLIAAYLPAGYWTLQNTTESAYIGHWDDTDEVAGNAGGDRVGNFDFYAITRGQYVSIHETLSNASAINPIDISYVISNPDATQYNRFHTGYSTPQPIGWTLSQDDAFVVEYASYLPSKVGDSYFNMWQASGTISDRSMSQTITGLPSGRYRLSVVSHSTTIASGAYLFANDQEADMTQLTDNTSSLTFDITDGTLELGVRLKDYTSNDCKFDHIALEFLGTNLAYDAVALPDGGAMEADTWYYYNLPTADDYDFTSSAAATLTYTQNGAQVTCEATGTDEVFTTGQKKTIPSLSAGRVYVKSDAATTLSIVYKYSVGSATADKSYIQAGNTVTVAWSDASTNDPGASFGKNGTSSVTFGGNAVDITPTSTGFTFTVPDGLSVATEYTLSIPADAFGYAAGSVYNAAQNITLKTPLVFDGTYFLKAENDGDVNGEYLSTGGGSGVRAVLDGNGLAIVVATDGQNKTTLKRCDTDKFYGMDNNGYDCWTDRTADDDYLRFNLVASSSPFDGKFFIHGLTTVENRYFKYNTADIHQYDNGATVIWADGVGASGSGYYAVQFSIDPLAVSDDYTAMTTAINTAKTNLGFEDGEYAPYNNTALMATLAEAEAINTSGMNPQSKIQGYATALAAANWTTNDGEVNAFRWNKSDYSGDNETALPTGGFVRTDNNSRISHISSNEGLGGLDQAMALAICTSDASATYGETTGYTLPLKASTLYRFTFKYAGWGGKGTPTITIYDPSGTSLKSKTYATPAKTGNDNTDAWISTYLLFTTTDAGNYKVTFSAAGERDAFGDLELKKAVPAPLALSEETSYTAVEEYADVTLTRSFNDGAWNTLVLPFDMTLSEAKSVFGSGITIANYTGTTTLVSGNDQLQFSTVDAAITAHQPVLIYGVSESGPYDIRGCSIGAGTPTLTPDGASYSFVGSYDASTQLAAGDYFIASNNNLYSVDAIQPTMKGTRAYFHPVAAGVKLMSFSIDDIATGINSIVSGPSTNAEGCIYNLAGQRMNKVQKGINIVNGHKILVK